MEPRVAHADRLRSAEIIAPSGTACFAPGPNPEGEGETRGPAASGDGGAFLRPCRYIDRSTILVTSGVTIFSAAYRRYWSPKNDVQQKVTGPGFPSPLGNVTLAAAVPVGSPPDAAHVPGM